MKASSSSKRKLRPRQHQTQQPGKEDRMTPAPIYNDPSYLGAAKLKDKVAVISGGDSGIGRAVALAFAKEGAHIVIVYLNESRDARKTAEEVRALGREVLCIRGDVGSEAFCRSVIQKTLQVFSTVDVLVNNAAEQHPQDRLEDISASQLTKTFATNVFSHFYLTKAALPHLKPGSSIIHSASVTAYRGSHHLIDYAATKGAIVALTRSLALQLIDRHIRVNAVAPGPVWTPLIPASFDAEHVAIFGSDVPMRRAAQPFEIAPSYVFLASSDSSYMTGQVLHPNGGEIINT